LNLDCAFYCFPHNPILFSYGLICVGYLFVKGKIILFLKEVGSVTLPFVDRVHVMGFFAVLRLIWSCVFLCSTSVPIVLGMRGEMLVVVCESNVVIFESPFWVRDSFPILIGRDGLFGLSFSMST